MIIEYSGISYFIAVSVVILSALIVFYLTKPQQTETEFKKGENKKCEHLQLQHQAQESENLNDVGLDGRTQEHRESKHRRESADGDSDNTDVIETSKEETETPPSDAEPVFRCPFSGMAMPGMGDFHRSAPAPPQRETFESRALADPVEYMEHIQGEVKRVHAKAAERTIEAQMTEDQKVQERKTQQEQMEAIFKMMREQEEVFGVSSMDDMKQQMKLYM